MRVVAAISGLVVLSSCLLAGVASAEPVIQWRLENPFRFFQRPADTEKQIAAYRGLADKQQSPILDMERALVQSADAASGRPLRRGWARELFDGKRPGAAGAATMHVDVDPCWYGRSPSERTGRIGGCPDNGKVLPKGHVVLLTAPTLSGDCEWSIDGRKLSATACAKAARATVPYPAGASIELSQSGKPVDRQQIKVEDLLVVGIGDSFASGEGNPDDPVAFDTTKVIDYDNSQGFGAYPQRARPGQRNGGDLQFNLLKKDATFRNASARWLHRPCHRSLYSHQLRAALQLAVDDPALHRAVTFLGFACEGSTIRLGLFGAPLGRPDADALPSVNDPAASSRKVDFGQLDSVTRALCKPGRIDAGGTGRSPDGTHVYELDLDAKQKRIATAKLAANGRERVQLLYCKPEDRLRPIDVMLVSIGGNDVGFAGLVAYATLRGDRVWYAKAVGLDPRLKPGKANLHIPALQHNFGQLKQALSDLYSFACDGSDKAGCAGGAAAKPGAEDRVFLTAYPPMDYAGKGATGEGQYCADGQNGYDLVTAYSKIGNSWKPVSTWEFDAERAKLSQQFSDGSLVPTQRAAARDAGWNLVEEHRGAFMEHGICRTGGETEQTPRGPLPVTWNDTFPRRIYRRDNSLDPDSGSMFVPADPSQFRPYASRNRWFRTPNDAFLAVHYHDSSIGQTEIRLVSWSARSGAFHPTAEGQAAMADAVYKAVRQRLDGKR